MAEQSVPASPKVCTSDASSVNINFSPNQQQFARFIPTSPTPNNAANPSQVSIPQSQVHNDNKIDYEKMFNNMIADLEEKRSKIEHLRILLDTMQNQPDVFDDEDINEASAIFYQKTQELATLEEQYKKKINYYENVLVGQKGKLELRQSILEQLDKSDKVLQENPDLMQYFVKKQAKLTQLYNETCRQLSH